jgi:serine protease inhibitor
MTPRDQDQQREYGTWFQPEVKNVISLTLAFAKAVGSHQKDKADNLVVSPYNAIACLAMVAKGADGATREELARTLFNTGAENLDVEIAKYAALNAAILEANKDQVTISTANGVWTNKDLVTLRQSYADDLKQTMGADISAENYADPATVDKINAWAAKNTNGLIQKVIESLSADDAAVLASSLYFKGLWTSKFDVALTEDKPFAADDAQTSATPTMHQNFEEGLRYAQGNGFEAVALTYGEINPQEGKYPTMRIVLARPTDETVSARDWLASQEAGKVPAWLDPSAFKEATGTVELPHLDIKQKHDLIPPLKEMGVQSAFNSGADFTGMVEENGDQLYVSKVSHDTVFKTDELGSEGAAVTTAVMTLECMMPDPVQIDIKLDRSFVFAVQDVATNAVLFIGAVNKPNDDMKPVKAPAAPKI